MIIIWSWNKIGSYLEIEGVEYSGGVYCSYVKVHDFQVELGEGGYGVEKLMGHLVG